MNRVDRARPILDLIARHESKSSVKAQGVKSAYQVVWGGIAAKDRPKDLTAMTVGKVLWWQDLIDAKYMSEAAGRYQVMEDTLRALPVDRSRLFDAACQDDVGLMLLDRRGWAQCKSGKLSPEEFGDNLAKEWASLPVIRGAKRGRSYYAGDGLNRAGATPDEAMTAIRTALEMPALDAEPPAPEEDPTVAWLKAAPLGVQPVGAWIAAFPLKGSSA